MSGLSSEGISDRTGLRQANIMQKSHYVKALSWRVLGTKEKKKRKQPKASRVELRSEEK